jgi:hypothetical protein
MNQNVRSAPGWLEAGDATAGESPLSDGEVRYVWWFIQGSIKEPDIR